MTCRVTSYTLSGILLHSLNPSTCHPLILLNFFIFCPQFHHQNPNLFICCLLCLTNIWGHFGFALGDIWLPDSQLPKNPLPCWIHLLTWDPPLGVLLETRLACVGELHPVFLARSRCRVAEDNSKCLLGFIPGRRFFWTSCHGMVVGTCAQSRWQEEAPASGSITALPLHIHIYQEFNNLCMMGFD